MFWFLDNSNGKKSPRRNGKLTVCYVYLIKHINCINHGRFPLTIKNIFWVNYQNMNIPDCLMLGVKYPFVIVKHIACLWNDVLMKHRLFLGTKKINLASWDIFKLHRGKLWLWYLSKKNEWNILRCKWYFLTYCHALIITQPKCLSYQKPMFAMFILRKHSWTKRVERMWYGTKSRTDFIFPTHGMSDQKQIFEKVRILST